MTNDDAWNESQLHFFRVPALLEAAATRLRMATLQPATEGSARNEKPNADYMEAREHVTQAQIALARTVHEDGDVPVTQGGTGQPSGREGGLR